MLIKWRSTFEIKLYKRTYHFLPGLRYPPIIHYPLVVALGPGLSQKRSTLHITCRWSARSGAQSRWQILEAAEWRLSHWAPNTVVLPDYWHSYICSVDFCGEGYCRMYDSSTGGLHLEHGHNYSSFLQISIPMDMLCNRNEITPCTGHT